MKLTNVNATIRSEVVEETTIVGSSSTITAWLCEVDGYIRVPESNEPIEFNHATRGKTPSDAWENMLRDLDGAGVEL